MRPRKDFERDKNMKIECLRRLFVTSDTDDVFGNTIPIIADDI